MSSDQPNTKSGAEHEKPTSDSAQTSLPKKTEPVIPEFEGALVNQLVTKFG